MICKNKTTCGVCAGEHLTKEYPHTRTTPQNTNAPTVIELDWWTAATKRTSDAARSSRKSSRKWQIEIIFGTAYSDASPAERRKIRDPIARADWILGEQTDRRSSTARAVHIRQPGLSAWQVPNHLEQLQRWQETEGSAVIQNSQLVIVEDSDFIHPNIATGVLHLNNNEKIILVSLYVNIKEFRRLTWIALPFFALQPLELRATRSQTLFLSPFDNCKSYFPAASAGTLSP